MQRARPMTVLTADGEFAKGRVSKQTLAISHRLRLPAVAGNASRGYRPVEAIVRDFVTRRKPPAFRAGIIGERRLKQVISAPHKKRIAVDSRTDHILELVSSPEDFMSGCVDLIVRLKDILALLRHLEVTVEFLAENRRCGGHVLALTRTGSQIHGSAHGGADIVLVDLRVAACALTRPDVSHAGLRIAISDIPGGHERRGREKRYSEEPHQACNFSSTQCASLSAWQRRQALGLSSGPKRRVISALGMSSIWCVRALKSTLFMMRGMWQDTHRLASWEAA